MIYIHNIIRLFCIISYIILYKESRDTKPENEYLVPFQFTSTFMMRNDLM